MVFLYATTPAFLEARQGAEDLHLAATLAEMLVPRQCGAEGLSTCVLTTHALLHIPDDILNAGPMWCYWNYVTERYVGYLARCSKSRKNPYASLARRVREIAQNNVIKMSYRLYDDLDLSDSREEDKSGHYLDHSFLHPNHRLPSLRPSDAVRKAVENYLLLTFDVDKDQACALVPPEVSHWGKVSFLDGGDKIRGADLVGYSEKNMTRDASFIKYFHQVDKNARHRRLPVVLERRVAYGQLLRTIEFFADLPPTTNDAGEIIQQPKTLLLAVIRPVKLLAQSKTLGTPYYRDGDVSPIEVIDVDDISCLVSRIPDHQPGPRKWALWERHDAMGVASSEGFD
ncbi:hypothetical protein R3P38DRAFT_3232395 [Favolaschia claudopus]|uniref:Uncharacterized protein n=1 Tax=Favolaschia claudopus TaxID=2862362 RepID=A0AAV9ZJF0_9AGAR